MRTIRFLLQKEFRQIFRNRSLLIMMFAVPNIQLLILPLVANYEIKNINLSIVDHDHSPYSQKLASKIFSSGYFRNSGFDNSFNGAFKQIESDKADLILEIPLGFEQDLVRENQKEVFIAINAINGTKANLGGAYLARIIMDYNSDIRLNLLSAERFNALPIIDVAPINWFNRFLEYPLFMVPGLLVNLVTIMCTLMCAINIVKEKEVGTIEQINVTPIKKYQFILGKLIPFWVIGILVFTIGLYFDGRLIYGVIPVGNLGLLYAFLCCYLVVLLGVGLLISTYAETQQQAMTIAFFFLMIFILMSGLFTPIDSMPEWAKIIAECNPVTYFIDVIRMVVLKGSGFKDIKYHFLVIILFGIIFNTWAMMNYRKTS